MGKKVKVGVFGAARGMALIEVLAKHADAELTAICDKYVPLLDRSRKLTEEAGLKVTHYTDFEDFFSHDLDAVVLANYAHEHAPFAIRLLDSGRHVISELLPTETMGQAVALTEAVERSGKVYAYAENCCYFTNTAEMKRLYQAGEIGEFMHGEGEYVHDCEAIWPLITYGERDHWRNRMYSAYYCSHSIGPILTITGLRPVKVIGVETPSCQSMADVGYLGGTSAMEILQMSNGATVKSLHGGLKREPPTHWFSVYGTKGMMETHRWNDDMERVYLYREGDPLTNTEICYRAKPRMIPKASHGHGGSDFYAVHYFLEKILGRPGGQEMIDIYTALDMSLPGILAHRSICNGSIPLTVPDFRIPAEREPYRHDNWCTNPDVAGDDLAPLCSFGSPDIPDSVYDKVRKTWLEKTQGQ